MMTVALTLLAGMIVAMFLATAAASLIGAFNAEAPRNLGSGRRIFY